MNILIVTNSFIVKESLENLFNKIFVYSKVKTILSIYDIDKEEFIFIIKRIMDGQKSL